MSRSVLRLLWPAVVLACTSTDAIAPWPPTFERVYGLDSDEGVFAYSRISPDGRFLAFPETVAPAGLALVLIWGTWSAHAPQALVDFQRARDAFESRELGIRVFMATEPGSREEDVARTLSTHGVRLPRIPLAPERLVLTEAHNQNPTTLLFREGTLVDRRLGAQTLEELIEWVTLRHRR